MKRSRLPLAIALIVVLLAGGVTFANRGAIRESYQKWQRGPIPEAVSRTDIQPSTGGMGGGIVEEPLPVPDETTDEPADEPTDEPAEPAETPKPADEPTPEPKPTPRPSGEMPAAFNLKVPFIPQAPHKVWDPVHEDACEEAAMLTIYAYMKDEFNLSLDEIDRRLLANIDYQTERYGNVPSISAEKVVQVMRDYLKLNARAMPVTSIEDVKREIAAGRPVLLLASGKELKNPNFKNGGPEYHALVAKGYTKTTIITNDPGTRLGADYAYDNGVLFDAIHDWNDGNVLAGAKIMIIVE